MTDASRQSTRPTLPIAGAFAGLAATVAIEVGASFGFSGGLLGLAVAVLLLASLVSVIQGFRTNRWHAAKGYGAALLIVLVGMYAGMLITKWQRQASMAAAQPIIIAAQQYRADNGAYPASLADLVPRYLPTEPHTRMGFGGRRFHLSSSPDNFRITFEVPDFMICVYNSGTGHWLCHD